MSKSAFDCPARLASSAQSSGIDTDALVPSRTLSSLTIQNNYFLHLQQPADVTGPSLCTAIEDDVSRSISGASPVTMNGLGKVHYGGNFWDKAPAATVTGRHPCAHARLEIKA